MGWDILLWVHLIAMAFFVGGQLVLAAAIVPVLKGVNGGEQMRAVARRFGWGTLIAIVVLLLTGAGIASHEHLWKSPELHTKLTLVVVVAGLIILHMRKPQWRALDGLIFIVSLAIVWLGVGLAS
jgi:uncharacterized membrane protein